MQKAGRSQWRNDKVLGFDMSGLKPRPPNDGAKPGPKRAWAPGRSATIPAWALYASFDADRYAAADLASADAWGFGFDPDRQGGSVGRFAALDGLGL